MVKTKDYKYNNDISQIIGMQFSIFSPEEIEKRSVAEIVTQEGYESDNPKIGGLFDPRMGVLENGKLCPTDKLDNKLCPGYFGHINLAVPVFYIHFFNYLKKIIKCYCWKCSRILLDVNDSELMNNILSKKGINRFNYVYSKIQSNKSKVCQYCNTINPNTIKKDGTSIARFVAEWKIEDEPKTMIWNAEYILNILKKIIDSDVKLIGMNPLFCRPDWLICQKLPVPPPYVRPSVRNETNTRMEDDITHKLCDILKTNRSLRQKINQSNTINDTNIPTNIIEEWSQLLQYHVATLIDNTTPGIPLAQQRSGRPLKSIKERLKSKEGRVRGNLMGKRVDYSARSVITPDPNIKINELGVPKKIAENLTFPEVVTKFNKLRLQSCVENASKWPGAKSVYKCKKEQLYSLKQNNNKLNLEVGDIVNRHLINGDIVLFNRQPSLHKMSMMVHRVVIIKYSSFRLNPSVTTPYNADFDGDEMNMHVPQSIQTALEIDMLASVNTQIISPANHKPIISLVQDTLLGSYLFTNPNVLLSKNQVYGLLSKVTGIDINKLSLPDIRKDEEVEKGFHSYEYINYMENREDGKMYWKYDLWKGQKLINLILPPINFKRKNGLYEINSKKENIVVIKSGKIQSGIMDKTILGGKEQGIIHIIHNDFGYKTCSNFINNIQSLITNYMFNHSFTVGIGDLITNSKTKLSMLNIINEKKKAAIEIIRSIHDGSFENNSSKSNYSEFELKVFSILNEALNETGKNGIKHLSNNNNIINIIRSGSKGTPINICQMLACVGQQNVDGKRIPFGFTDRTLPHFHKFDDGPAARGFVENSFLDGLNPTEFFFHAMSGREGVIDTAVKTSETGYIQRRLIKAMEDIKICMDSTVRDANNNIVQFIYGEDGFDGHKIEKIGLNIITKSNNQIENEYSLNKVYLENKLSNTKDINLDEIIDRNTSEVKKIIELKDYVIKSVYKENLTDNCLFYPINIKRIIEYSINNFPNNYKYTDLNLNNVFDKIEELIVKCQVSNSLFSLNKVFEILLRIELSPRILIDKNISQLCFNNIYIEIINKFYKSLVEPGTLVGTIAAQSIGEPATQMTLNTFHFAGVSSKSAITRGVPRLKEIISVTRNLKSPLITIHPQNEYAYDKNNIIDIVNQMELTYIKDLLVSSKIYFDPTSEDELTSIEGDKSLLEIFQLFEDKVDKKNPWILRMIFSKIKMIDKHVAMFDIFQVLNTHFNSGTDKLNIVYSDDNSDELIFRIRKTEEEDDEEDSSEDIIDMLTKCEKTIQELVIKGIKGIQNVDILTQNDSYIKIDGEYINKKKLLIEVEGNSLLDILTEEYINSEMTYSNNIRDICEIFGIEAARESLIRELTELISYDGTYVNSRHIVLLADTMTYRGYLMSIDRHGINKSERGPLSKATFEETPDILIKAAIFGELDNMQGVSSNIMLGQEIKSGTGSVDIIFDEKMYVENEDNLNTVENDVFTESDYMESNCNIQNIQNNIEVYVDKEEIDQSLMVSIQVEIV